jgi:hypothetical protein
VPRRSAHCVALIASAALALAAFALWRGCARRGPQSAEEAAGRLRRAGWQVRPLGAVGGTRRWQCSKQALRAPPVQSLNLDADEWDGVAVVVENADASIAEDAPPWRVVGPEGVLADAREALSR